MATNINDLPSDVIHNILEKCETLKDLSRTIKVDRHIYCAFDQRRRAILAYVIEQHFNFSQTTIAQDVFHHIISKKSRNIGRQLPREVLKAYTNECRDAHEAWQEDWMQAQVRAWEALEFLGNSSFLYVWSRNFIRGCIDHQRYEIARRTAEVMWRRVQDDCDTVDRTVPSKRVSLITTTEREIALMLAEIYRYSSRRDDALQILQQMFKAEWTLEHTDDVAMAMINLACHMDRQQADYCDNPRDGILIPLLRERASAEAKHAANISKPTVPLSLFWHGQLVNYLRRPPHTRDVNRCCLQGPTEQTTKRQVAVSGSSSPNRYLHEALTIQRRSIAIHRENLQKRSSEIDGHYLGKIRVLCDLLDISGNVEESLRVQQEVYDEIVAIITNLGKARPKYSLNTTTLYSHASQLVRKYRLAGRKKEAVGILEDLWGWTLESMGTEAGQGRGPKMPIYDGELLYHAKNVAYGLEKLYEELGMAEQLANLRATVSSIWRKAGRPNFYDDKESKSDDEAGQVGGAGEESSGGAEFRASLPWSAREIGMLYVNGDT